MIKGKPKESYASRIQQILHEIVAQRRMANSSFLPTGNRTPQNESRISHKADESYQTSGTKMNKPWKIVIKDSNTSYDKDDTPLKPNELLQIQ
jgi:hypothetical protein